MENFARRGLIVGLATWPLAWGMYMFVRAYLAEKRLGQAPGLPIIVMPRGRKEVKYV